MEGRDPGLSQPSGTFNVNLNVTITVATAGATIRYTQTGTEPTEADPTVVSGGSVAVTASQTLKAKAFKVGQPASNTESATYLMQVGPIVVSPSASTYTTPQSVSMTSGTPGTTIRYTTDGSTPGASSTV